MFGCGNLCCHAQPFFSCSEWELHLLLVHGLLTAVFSLVSEYRLQDMLASIAAAHRLSSCKLQTPEQAQQLCCRACKLLSGMWNLPRPKFESMFSEQEGRFLSTAQRRKSQNKLLNAKNINITHSAFSHKKSVKNKNQYKSIIIRNIKT